MDPLISKDTHDLWRARALELVAELGPTPILEFEYQLNLRYDLYSPSVGPAARHDAWRCFLSLLGKELEAAADRVGTVWFADGQPAPEDHPRQFCDVCERCTWSVAEYGESCATARPGAGNCPGYFRQRYEDIPAHLRPDAPMRKCSDCGRETVAIKDFSRLCGMVRPDGSFCAGIFNRPVSIHARLT